MSPPRDRATLDLFEWEPPKLVRRFEEVRVRAATLRQKISLAVSETMKEAEASREDIAARMSAWLGEDTSKPILDAYASQAREEHTISLLRVLALIEATGDLRILQMAAEMFGHSVIENRYLPWIEVGQLSDKKDEFDRAFDAARRNARKGLKP